MLPAKLQWCRGIYFCAPSSCVVLKTEYTMHAYACYVAMVSGVLNANRTFQQTYLCHGLRSRLMEQTAVKGGGGERLSFLLSYLFGRNGCVLAASGNVWYNDREEGTVS
ncbi:hypothetical protein TRVL_08559 [Trypanosoma vivax]|nr:hypothetical protein TRVL_08559 [Trypanosoma vivax]